MASAGACDGELSLRGRKWDRTPVVVEGAHGRNQYVSSWRASEKGGIFSVVGREDEAPVQNDGRGRHKSA